MGTIKGLAVGWDLSRRLHHSFTGSVHSVFPHTVNIMDDQGGCLYCLSSRGSPVPNGLLVPPQGTFAGFIRPGERVVNCGPFLLVMGSGQAAYTCRDVPVWQPVPHPVVDVHPARLRANLQRLRILLGGRGGLAALLGWRIAGDPLSTLAKTALPAVLQLEHSLRQMDPGGLQEALQGLLGLGPGLTPAGDDFLAGMLAAFHVTAPSHPLLETFHKEVLARARNATNIISFTMLKYAGMGQGPPGALAAAAAVAAGDPANLDNAVAEVLAAGATSGGDILTGIAFGCLMSHDIDCELEGSGKAFLPRLS